MSSSNDDDIVLKESCEQWRQTIFNMGDFYTDGTKITLLYNLSSQDLEITSKFNKKSKTISVNQKAFVELEIQKAVYTITNPVFYIYYIQPEFVYIICIDDWNTVNYCRKIRNILYRFFPIKEWVFNELMVSNKKISDKFIYDFFKNHTNKIEKEEKKEEVKPIEKAVEKVLSIPTPIKEHKEHEHIVVFIEPEQHVSAQFLNNLRTFTEHNKNIVIVCPDNSPTTLFHDHRKRIIKYSSISNKEFENINVFKFFILKMDKNRLLISSNIVKNYKCLRKIDFLHNDFILYSKSNLNPNFIGDIEMLGFDYSKNKKIFDHLEKNLKIGGDIKTGLITLSDKHKEDLKKMNVCLLPKHSFQPLHSHPVFNTPLSYTCKK